MSSFHAPTVPIPLVTDLRQLGEPYYRGKKYLWALVGVRDAYAAGQAVSRNDASRFIEAQRDAGRLPADTPAAANVLSKLPVRLRDVIVGVFGEEACLFVEPAKAGLSSPGLSPAGLALAALFEATRAAPATAVPAHGCSSGVRPLRRVVFPL